MTTAAINWFACMVSLSIGVGLGMFIAAIFAGGSDRKE